MFFIEANEDDTQPSTTEQKGTTTTTRPEDLPKAHKFVGNPESGVSNNKDFVFLGNFCLFLHFLQIVDFFCLVAVLNLL